jgi:two-component system NarL family response regulator
MRALVVEDDELFRLGLEMTLQGFAGIEAVTAVADGEQALALVRQQEFSVILLDLGLPGLGGLETCRRLSAEHPGIPVLVITSQEDQRWCRKLLEAGACGYVHKGIAAEDLELAVQTVLRGASWWDADATASIRDAQTSTGTGEDGVHGEDPLLGQLTRREREVLDAMGRGWSNREIAEALGISVGTVRMHGHSIMQKLQVANRTQAVLKLKA